MGMQDEWVVIATADNLIRAQLAVAHLQSEGINARIEHELISSLIPSFGTLPSGVQIKVHWKEARSAYDLLEAYQTDGGGLWL
jgi:hypothetical protein